MDKRQMIYPTKEKLKWHLPISAYLVILCIAVWLMLLYFKNYVDADNEAAVYVLNFVRQFIAITLLLVVILAFVTTFIPWLLLRNRKNDPSFSLKLSNDENNHIFLQTKPVLKPFGGFLKVSFSWEKDNMTPPVELQEVRSENKSSNNNLTKYLTTPDFPNITDYNIDHVVWYFVDFLQLFRFRLMIPKKLLVVNNPKITETKVIPIHPLKTQEETEKVFSNRKTAGDLYNFKQYESNDDIRRIVWPLYAKTGELMVRNPEIQNQYASDASIYASFYSGINISNEDLSNDMLDFYKNVVFTAYKRLKEKEEFSLYFTTSQNSQTSFSQEKDILMHLTSCSWGNEFKVDQLPHADQTSLVIVSSLDDTEALATLVAKDIYGMEFLFVPLSEAFKNPENKKWLQWLFFHSRNENTMYRQFKWRFSTLHKRIEENEQKIAHILSQKPTLTSLQ